VGNESMVGPLAKLVCKITKYEACSEGGVIKSKVISNMILRYGISLGLTLTY